jgi:hypothetical protein
VSAVADDAAMAPPALIAHPVRPAVRLHAAMITDAATVLAGPDYFAGTNRFLRERSTIAGSTVRT